MTTTELHDAGRDANVGKVENTAVRSQRSPEGPESVAAAKRAHEGYLVRLWQQLREHGQTCGFSRGLTE